MRRRLAASAAFFAFCAGTPAVAAPPIEAYGELPSISGLGISPNGERFSYLAHSEGGDFFVIAEQGKGLIFSGDTGKIKPWYTGFATDKHAILFATRTMKTVNYDWDKFEHSGAVAYNIETGHLTTLLTKAEGLMPVQTGIGDVVGVLAGSDFVFMPAFARVNNASPSRALYKVDLNTGRGAVVARGTEDTRDYFVNLKGVVLAREEFDDVTDEYRVFAGRDGDLKKIFSKIEPLPMQSVLGVMPDETGLVMAGEANGEKYASLYSIGFDGKTSVPLFQRAGASIAAIIVDDNKTMRGVRYDGLFPSYAFFDAELTRDMEALASMFPDDAVSYISATSDLKRISISVEGGKTAPAYFLFDRESRKLIKLAPKYSAISDADINPVTPIEYRARDGRTIPSVLAYPRGKTLGDKLPLIVMPHGGPTVYDAVGFDWMAQYFASRGYLVFQPNFRGSEGFGREHREAGYGEWGRKMQDDVTDGAELLIRKGWADPNRTCIIGGSYGGYAALAGGAYTPDLYKCVAAIAPVSDLNFMLSETRREAGSASAEYTWWTKLIGSQKDDKAKIEAISPVNAAANFKAPVLLVHGNDDTVVPFEHSARMESALKKAGKPVTLVKLQDGDHWLSKSDVRLQTLRELDKFVEAAIGTKQ